MATTITYGSNRHDQTSYLPLKYILDNVLLAHETIDWAKRTKQLLVLLKFDFAKALWQNGMEISFPSHGKDQNSNQVHHNGQGVVCKCGGCNQLKWQSDKKHSRLEEELSKDAC